MRSYEDFAIFRPANGDASNLRIVNPQSAAMPADTGFRSPLESCPGAKSVLQDAADQLGLKNFVTLTLDRSGPAAAVEGEILKKSIPAKRPYSTPLMSGFVLSPESVIRLLRTHGRVGGRFIADHLERRAHLYECWTVSIRTDFVDACAYRGNKAAFFIGSDFAGEEQYAEALDNGEASELAEVQPEVGDQYVHCGHIDRAPLHFWRSPDGPNVFVRPNGSVGHAKWIVCCDECFHRAKGNPQRLGIRGDAVWTVDGPLCKKADNPYGANAFFPSAQRPANQFPTSR